MLVPVKKNSHVQWCLISLLMLLANRVAALRDLTDQNVKDINAAKNEIVSVTKETDLLLFLGNTTSYFYYALKKDDKREAELVPTSGRYYAKYLYPEAEAKNYPKGPDEEQEGDFYANNPEPKLGRHKNYNRVVLIDHTLRGESVDQFVMLLNHMPKINKVERGFINIVSPEIQQQIAERTKGFEGPPTLVDTIHKVVMKDDSLIDGLARSKFGRLAIDYTVMEFEEVDAEDAQKEFESKSPQKKMIAKIRGEWGDPD
ncbi:Uu.00g110180.m01.CDS01 [Anthostomella pinea]|uniref:Uu.00g110180.m01.CDS01 n=1 Tax=Anthostomella pinea TaxID=933095 RepID=A0AAI8VFT5_9PEZI|nr:Uu.00g110180.m01.CDS01 [Anthostomella pinea]